MFPVTITIHNAVQLNAVMNAMDGLPVPKKDETKVTATEVREHREQHGSTMAEAKAAVTKAKEKAAEPKKPTPEPEQPSSQSTGTTSESEPLDAQSDSGELAGDEKTYTIEDAKDMTKKAVVTGKKEAMIWLLAKYNVAKTVFLKPEQIQPFCVEAEGLLK